MDLVIADAVRTPTGLPGGALNRWHAVDLLAVSLQAIRERNGLDADSIDEVIAACETPIGEQALNIGRNAVLASDWPSTIPAYTVDASAAGGFFALRGAGDAVVRGRANAVVAASVSSPSHVPPGSETGVATGKPFGPSMHQRFVESGGLLAPGAVTERLAAAYGLDRDQLDSYALRSRQLAASTDTTKASLVPVPVRADCTTQMDPWVHEDELPCNEVRALKPTFETDGVITAANMAQPVDGSNAVLMTSAAVARNTGMAPLARVVSAAVSGSEPLLGDSGYRVALAALANAGIAMSDISIVDVHEDSAVTPLAFAAEAQHTEVNVCGGALATGRIAGGESLSSVVRASHALSAGAGRYALCISAGASSMSCAIVLEVAG